MKMLSDSVPDLGQVLSRWGEKLHGLIPSGSTFRPYDSDLSFAPVSADLAQNDMAKREIIAKLISTLVGATLSIGITYFGVKYLMNVMDPTQKEKLESQKRAQKLLKKIGVSNVKLSEYELCIASNLVDPLSMTISWKDIGGLQQTIQEIRETVILPFQRHELFKDSTLIQSPKGVLLYGPPGCGKTLIAKATAKAAGARFINLQVSSLVDKWYGESQKRAEAVFSLALKLQPVIIFIDEIDSFLRSRTSSDHEATAMIKTQFMSFWDGLMTDNQCRIMIMGATNRPSDVDAAILRRMPSMFHIGLPDAHQRKQILSVILRDEPVDADVDLDYISQSTSGLSGSDLKELCRTAAIYRLREYISTEMAETETDVFHPASESVPDSNMQLRRISRQDFDTALLKMKETKNITLLKDIAVD